MTVTLAVLGVPAPQGSKTRMPNGAVIEGSSPAGRAKHQAWREAVAWQARNCASGKPPLDGALYVVASFRFPMPASRPKSTRDAGACWHAVKPDLDKVIRCTLDGLKDGGLIADDSRVASITATAIEVTSWTGAVIQIHHTDALDAVRQERETTDALEVWGLTP